MRNYLKVLGLAFVAALALSAVAASSASAQQGVLTSEADNAVTLTGTETGEGKNFLESYGGKTECPGSTVTGHEVKSHEETTHAETTEEVDHSGLIPNKSTETTITPHYVNCTSTTPFGNKPTTVEMTGCDYVFTLGNTTPAENTDGTYGVTTHIECPEGSTGIHVRVFEDEAHTEQLCSITVTPNQANLTGLHATNTTAGDDIDVKGLIHGIHSVRSGLCTLDGKGTTDADGTFTADVTVEAHEELGLDEGVTISDEV